MITISQRVLHAIELMRQGKYEFALEQAAFALHLLKQSFFGNRNSFAFQSPREPAEEAPHHLFSWKFGALRLSF
jgi:hypothetical protein